MAPARLPHRATILSYAQARQRSTVKTKNNEKAKQLTGLYLEPVTPPTPCATSAGRWLHSDTAPAHEVAGFLLLPLTPLFSRHWTRVGAPRQLLKFCSRFSLGRPV